MPNKYLGIDLGPLTQNTRCILLCRDLGYMFAGTEVGRVCFCGDDPWQYTAADVDPMYVGNYDCDKPCQADPSEICGGFWRLSVYRTGVKSDSSLTVQSRTVERQYIMMGEDKKINDNIAFISSVNVKSKFHCAVLCSMYEACTGFVYSRITGMYQLYRIKYQDLCDFTLTEGGSSIYMID